MGTDLLAGEHDAAPAKWDSVKRRLHDLGGRDPYELLGVEPDATAAEIVAAHRRRIREVHPDRPGGDEDATKLLHVAREVLLDDEERAEYDRLRAEGLDPLTDVPPAYSVWDSEDVVDGATPPPAPPPIHPPLVPPRVPPAYTAPSAWTPAPPRATSGLPLGVWALILSSLCTPIGLVPAIIALSRRPPPGSADRICAIIAVCLSAFGLSTCALWGLLVLVAGAHSR